MFDGLYQTACSSSTASSLMMISSASTPCEESMLKIIFLVSSGSTPESGCELCFKTNLREDVCISVTYRTYRSTSFFGGSFPWRSGGGQRNTFCRRNQFSLDTTSKPEQLKTLTFHHASISWCALHDENLSPSCPRPGRASATFLLRCNNMNP